MKARALGITVVGQNPRKPLLVGLALLLLLILCTNDTARAAAIIFTNSGGGDWSVAANWSPNLVPGSGDSAFITNKTVTLDVSPNVAGLTLTSAILEGPGSLTVNGVFVWNSGTIENTGGLTLNGTSAFDGTAAGTLLLGTPLTNGGALTWSGGGANLTFANGQGTVTNLTNGTITIAANVSTQPAGATIGNAGLLINATGSATLNAALVNTGTVQVQSGILNLNNGGTESGAADVASGATLDFTGGTHTVLPGFSATGPGGFTISTGFDTSATVNFDEAGCTMPNLTFSGGTLAGTNGLLVNGPFTWSSGTMQNSGGVTLNGASSIIGTSDTINLNGTVLTNAGTLTWSGAGFSIDFGSLGGTLTNLPTATINITTAFATQGPGTIGNAGLMTKINSTGAVSLAETFVNTGTLSIQTGTMVLDDSSKEAGVVNVAAGAGLYFEDSTHTVLPGFSAPGPGSLVIDGGTVNFDNPAGTTLPNLTFTNGTIGGSNTLAVNGPFVWSNGTMQNTGGVKLNGASSIIGINNNINLNGTVLTNAGTLTWSGAAFSIDFGSLGGVLTNLPTATINITTAFATQGPGTIGNAGLMTKTNSNGTVSLGETFVNTGTLSIQEGTIDLTSGYALANGMLSFGINGPTSYGKLGLSGAMSSKCRLAANLNGFYWPPVGTAFNLMSYTSETGAFFTNTALPAFITWQTNYNATTFTLTVDARQTNTTPTRITMSPAGNTNLDLAWPGDHTGWQLETQTNSLAIGLSTNWVIVPGSNLTNQMTFPIGLANSAVFFQLMYP